MTQEDFRRTYHKDQISRGRFLSIYHSFQDIDWNCKQTNNKTKQKTKKQKNKKKRKKNTHTSVLWKIPNGTFLRTLVPIGQSEQKGHWINNNNKEYLVQFNKKKLNIWILKS